MFKSSELGDELQALKSEMSRLLNTSADDMFDAAKSSAEALAEQIKDTLNELGETLSAEEEYVERLIAERPIAALASAFALGIAIGFMTVFSDKTSPEIAFSPSDLAYSMIICISVQPSPLPLRSDRRRMAYSPLS